jgi:hypothetical protein
MIIFAYPLRITLIFFLYSFPWLVGIEKPFLLFHNAKEGSGKLASQSVYFLSLHWAASCQVAHNNSITLS